MENDAVNEYKKWKGMKVEELIPAVLTHYIDKFQKRTGGERIGKSLLSAISSEEFLGGCCLPALRTFANKDLRSNFFTPQACARAADLSGGKLNGSTWTCMRSIYNDGKKNA